MFGSWFGYLIIFMIGFWSSSIANATTLTLQSGQTIRGQIIEQTQLRVTMDVDGFPKTFFWGEIASIDGKKAEIPQAENAVTAPQAETVVTVPQTETVGTAPKTEAAAAVSVDEEDSLIRFMNVRRVNAATVAAPPTAASPVVASPAATVPVPPRGKPAAPPASNRKAEGNKNVISTPDSGVIVIGAEKIVKYDEDLNVVKEINLNADPAAGSK